MGGPPCAGDAPRTTACLFEQAFGLYWLFATDRLGHGKTHRTAAHQKKNGQPPVYIKTPRFLLTLQGSWDVTRTVTVRCSFLLLVGMPTTFPHVPFFFLHAGVNPGAEYRTPTYDDLGFLAVFCTGHYTCCIPASSLFAQPLQRYTGLVLFTHYAHLHLTHLSPHPRTLLVLFLRGWFAVDATFGTNLLVSPVNVRLRCVTCARFLPLPLPPFARRRYFIAVHSFNCFRAIPVCTTRGVLVSTHTPVLFAPGSNRPVFSSTLFCSRMPCAYMRNRLRYGANTLPRTTYHPDGFLRTWLFPSTRLGCTSSACAFRAGHGCDRCRLGSPYATLHCAWTVHCTAGQRFNATSPLTLGQNRNCAAPPQARYTPQARPIPAFDITTDHYHHTLCHRLSSVHTTLRTLPHYTAWFWDTTTPFGIR